MKNLLLTLVFTLCMYSINAQEVKINEPEFAGSIVYVNVNDSIGNGIPLEQQVGIVQTNTSGIIKIKSVSKEVVKGCCSPIKINQTTNVRFIVRTSDNSYDPATIINIFQLTKNGDSREIELASAHATAFVGSSGSTNGNIVFLPFTAKKYGKNSYLIELASIQPGEYAMTLKERRDLFIMFEIE